MTLPEVVAEGVWRLSVPEGLSEGAEAEVERSESGVDEEGEAFDASVVDNRTQCAAGGHAWVTSFPNFDNALNGYLSLVHVAIFKGWAPIMYDAVDSRGVSSTG